VKAFVFAMAFIIVNILKFQNQPQATNSA